MNARQANYLLIGWVVLFFIVIAVAFLLTMKHRTKPSVFVPPAIWSERFTEPGDPPPQYDI